MKASAKPIDLRSSVGGRWEWMVPWIGAAEEEMVVLVVEEEARVGILVEGLREGEADKEGGREGEGEGKRGMRLWIVYMVRVRDDRWVVVVCAFVRGAGAV